MFKRGRIQKMFYIYDKKKFDVFFMPHSVDAKPIFLLRLSSADSFYPVVFPFSCLPAWFCKCPLAHACACPRVLRPKSSRETTESARGVKTTQQ